MKHLLFSLVFLSISFNGISQNIDMVIWMTPEIIIDGMCNEKFALAWDKKSNVVPKLEQSNEEIYSSIELLKTKTKLKAKGLIMGIVNCDGKMVTCDIIMEADEPLIEQLKAYFLEKSTWDPAIFSGNNIDAQIMRDIKIKKGKIYIK